MSIHEELIVQLGRWNLQYHHSEREILNRFFKELKENKRIMGIQCPRCSRVIVTPRRLCEKCSVPNEEWVELKDTGTIDTFTIQYTQMPEFPNTPYYLAFIKLDGADTALLHHVRGIDPMDMENAKKRLRAGMRVRAKWKDKREGQITDIEYFEPIEKD
ncbi:MAG: Zn-ribbon domain-containing OB-fold protein [Desulfatiglandales bacterium]